MLFSNQVFRRLKLSVFAAALMMACASGCGGGSSDDAAHLQGTVTLSGQPLPTDADGAITFRPAASGKGRPVTVKITDGRYDSPNTPKGPVKAYLNISKPTGRMLNSDRTGGQYPEVADILPARYRDGIDLDVTADKTDQDFHLSE